MENPNLKENPLKRALALPFRGFLKTFFPITYVKLQYKYITHHTLHLKNPVRYTEKLQYLRVYTYPKNKEVSRLASRDGLREYAHELGLDEYLVPMYGIYRTFDEIPWDTLPSSFVMKCTHASGMNEIIDNKDSVDKKALRKKFKKWLKTDYGKKTMERHYSRIKPQIIIEKKLDEDGHLPIEYKIHVFNGVAKSLYVVTGRGQDIRYTNFYIDWTRFDGSQFNGWKSSDVPIEKPKNFDTMILIAEKLAKPFPFVRVDLYEINGKIYISEMTFTPAKGTLILDDDRCDFEMGAWLDIDKEVKKK